MGDATSSNWQYWLSFFLDVLKFIAEAVIAIGIFYFGYQLNQEEAQPKLKQIGSITQFAGGDNRMTIRLKNYSTRQDAILTRIEYVVTDPQILQLVNKRRTFVKNSPPPLQFEDIAKTNDIQLTHCDWNYDGAAFCFTQDVDLAVLPGKSESIRVSIGSPSWNQKEWQDAWFTGTLTVRYDNDAIVIPNVNVFHKDLKQVGAVPPAW